MFYINVGFYNIFFTFRHLLDHKFTTPEKNGQSYRIRYPSDLQPSKKIHISDIEAVKKRFIECFIRSRPVLPQNALPKSGNFTLNHMIIGLYKQIIRILFKYTPEDFNSPYLYLYPISSLAKNLNLMKSDLHTPLQNLLFNLMERYNLTENQTFTCLSYLNLKLERPIEEKEEYEARFLKYFLVQMLASISPITEPSPNAYVLHQLRE